MSKRILWTAIGLLVVVFSGFFLYALLFDRYATVDEFMLLIDEDPEQVDRALKVVSSKWHPGNATMLLECDQAAAPGYFPKVEQVLERKLGVALGLQTFYWFRWIWNQDYQPHPDYAEFKARLYEQRDPRFREYFEHTENALIRLDEILWGGVERDGIPPLKNPIMLSAEGAAYLADDNVVFGIEINGDARAYPERILAWHEMFKDEIGGSSICGVYCTLCGSVIAYKTEFEGTHYELGTSGFLYRSNKLMYDHDTKSLWSTLRGRPVVGPLVGKGIELEMHYVVTTTWGEWRRRHPDTTVLSLETGHYRDYSEGKAYESYFADDRLMFHVPFQDRRLKNKAEVLVMRASDSNVKPLAVSAEHLEEHPVFHAELGAQKLVVLTDSSGANRVYACGEISIVEYDGVATAVDKDGGVWTQEEAHLLGPNGAKLSRVPAHRAFWFGWHAAFPETRLIK